MTNRGNFRAVPGQVWLACALLAVLRAIPFLVTRLTPSPAGFEYMPVGYNAKDWLSYVAFIRQDELLMANPFLTEPQGGRFILLFHTLLGKFSALTGMDPFVTLELSRVPLILAFFFVLWRFLGPVLPDIRHRVLACWLVAFSGGIEYLYLMVADLIPAASAATIAQATWHLQGWSTFAAFYNPLWIIALTLCLLVLKPILQPESPTARDRVLVGLGTFLLFFVHPYSAILVVAVYCVVPLLGWCLQRADMAGNSLALAAPLALALAGAGAIGYWQLQDPTFRVSSGGALGAQDLSVFWYPLTLGALLFFGLRGWQQWIQDSHPWRFGLGAWMIAVVALHASPLLNGYHFAMYLHIPLCIVAAGAVASTFDSIRNARFAVLRSAALVAVLFASSLSITVLSAREASTQSLVPSELVRVAEVLASQPRGNVLAPPGLGNMIPAYSDHRVFTGQWFLTPDFEARNAYYWTLVQDPATNSADLRELLQQQRIGYLVAPSKFAGGLKLVLGTAVTRELPVDSTTILVLGSAPPGVDAVTGK